MSVKELIQRLEELSPNKIVHVFDWLDYVQIKQVNEYEDIIEIVLTDVKR